jgi:hypothetical protein
MTGADVKRQVMEALWQTAFHDIREALAPCIVLTAEEAKDLSDFIRSGFFRGEPAQSWPLALLTTEQEKA